MNARDLWSKILIVSGGIGMLVGALDPMEGSLLILPGSGLLALGSYVGQAERRVFAYKVWAFVLILIGVSVLWFLPALRGFESSAGLSIGWELLAFLPYLVGWSMGIWGPGNPRWFSLLGIVVGVWYLAVAGIILPRAGLEGWRGPTAAIIATIGVVATTGCAYRLYKQTKARDGVANARA